MVDRVEFTNKLFFFSLSKTKIVWNIKITKNRYLPVKVGAAVSQITQQTKRPTDRQNLKIYNISLLPAN